MPYRLSEVDARDAEIAAILHRFNSLAPDCFPALQARHIENGYWWVAFLEDAPVAFAGLVAMEPFTGAGYLKRCYVMPDHYGHGIQYRMMMAREIKAKQLGWTQLVSECAAGNGFSANNFRRAGFDLCEPEQTWGAPGSLYWVKRLA